VSGALPWILAGVVLMAVVHVTFVAAFPYIVMAIARRVVRSPINQGLHLPPTTAEVRSAGRFRNLRLIFEAFGGRASSESRSVVRPSPDLLYSACVYDVSQKALRIRARVPGTYWSISFFANNTDNFFVMNDMQIAAKDVTFILVGKGRTYKAPSGARVVEAQSDRGIVLLRTLIKDQDGVDELIAIQKQAIFEEV